MNIIAAPGSVAAALVTVGEKLPASLCASLLAAGDAAVPELLTILESEDLGDADGPGKGWAPIHAVDLLVTLKAPAAIEPMLRILVTSSWEEILHDRILTRLPKLGSAVMDPALATLDDAEDPDDRHSLCCVLAKLGVRDDRIYEALCELFDDDETLGAMCFADYGDARALPILEALSSSSSPISIVP